MEYIYIGCVSSKSVVLDAENGYSVTERPTISRQKCNVYGDAIGSRMNVVFCSGEVNDILTSTVQNVIDAQGYHMVMTRNSAYLFK